MPFSGNNDSNLQEMGARSWTKKSVDRHQLSSLYIMDACLQKQAQLLLITLEARHGASTLQNHESILRKSKVSVLVKGSLIVLFALPLGLSASYKQFVSGTTDIDMNPMDLQFGPVGPPGLMNGATAVAVHASLVVTIPF